MKRKHKQNRHIDKKHSTENKTAMFSIEGKKPLIEWKTNTTTHPKMLALHDGFGSKDFARFYKNIKVMVEDH